MAERQQTENTPTGAYVLLMPLKTCCAKSETPSPILCALLISARTISFSLYLNLLTPHACYIKPCSFCPAGVPAFCLQVRSFADHSAQDLSTTLGLPRRAKTRMPSIARFGQQWLVRKDCRMQKVLRITKIPLSGESRRLHAENRPIDCRIRNCRCGIGHPIGAGKLDGSGVDILSLEETVVGLLQPHGMIFDHQCVTGPVVRVHLALDLRLVLRGFKRTGARIQRRAPTHAEQSTAHGTRAGPVRWAQSKQWLHWTQARARSRTFSAQARSFPTHSTSAMAENSSCKSKASRRHVVCHCGALAD